MGRESDWGVGWGQQNITSTPLGVLHLFQNKMMLLLMEPHGVLAAKNRKKRSKWALQGGGTSSSSGAENGGLVQSSEDGGPAGVTCKPLKAQSAHAKASMRDPKTGLMIFSSPKAGATLTARIVLARSNLTEEAMSFEGIYPLPYSQKVFNRMKGRDPHDFSPADCDANSRWFCAAIVRNPLDRAISSYIHTLRHWEELGSKFKELGGRADASYAEFAAALDRRAALRTTSALDSHFMPQWEVVPYGMDASPRLLHVPIEALSEPGGYECPLVEPMRGWLVAESEGKPVMGYHYIKKGTAVASGVEHLPFSSAMAMIKGGATYDSFWGNQTFCRHVIACLYLDDLRMYVAACKQPKLRECAAHRKACDAQLQRLVDVCGLDVWGDFL